MRKNNIFIDKSFDKLRPMTIKKMIRRLLTEDRFKTPLDDERLINFFTFHNEPRVTLPPFTKEELANKLKISEKALIGLMKSDIPLQLINDITKPLVSLYCSIKFVNGEYKGEENDERQTHTT